MYAYVYERTCKNSLLMNDTVVVDYTRVHV